MSEELKNVSVENTEASVSGVSKSRAKRDARKAEVKAEKRKAGFDKVIGWVVGIVIAAAVIGAIGMGIAQSVNTIVPDGNYSEGLTADGCITGANLNKVNDFNPENVKVPFSEVEYTDEVIDSDIASMVSNFKYFDESADLTVEDGSVINLDYVGSIDGVEFDGGNTQGNGATLTIGSHSYIDTFETQLIGSHPGDNVTVNVTFPEDYDNEELAGKAAVFECVINSVQVTPELTDEFVAENLSEYATTVEGLREFTRSEGYRGKLCTYLSEYITDNASVSQYPSAYTKHMRSLLKYTDEQNFQYYNSYYSYYLGAPLYNSFSDFTGMTDAEYNDSLVEKAKEQVAQDMTFEYLFKKYNLTITDEILTEIKGNMGGDTASETYGEGYINQVAMKYAVIYHLADTVVVE